MDYKETREKPFKGRYLYKVHFFAKVHWDNETETEKWNDESDKEYIDYVDTYFKLRNPDDFVRQGAVFYFKNLDTVFMCRLMFSEKIMKIDKATKTPSKETKRVSKRKTNPYKTGEVT